MDVSLTNCEIRTVSCVTFVTSKSLAVTGWSHWMTNARFVKIAIRNADANDFSLVPKLIGCSVAECGGDFQIRILKFVILTTAVVDS